MTELLACVIDGHPAASVPVQDRGLQYGDGVFTTVAVKSGVPLLWDRHLRRLMRDTASLQITPPAAPLLNDEVADLCRGVARGTLKVMLTRHSAGRGYRPTDEAPARRIVTLWPRTPDAQRAADGVSLCLCRTRLSRNPWLAGIKHLNRLEQVLARSEWGDDYAEGLMQDTEGAVIEGTMTNVFLARDGKLYTADLKHCGVAGVMRELVLERARAGIAAVSVQPLSLAAVHEADEIFLTNSLIGIWPVRRFETKEYRIGPITRAVRTAIVDAHDGA